MSDFNKNKTKDIFNDLLIVRLVKFVLLLVVKLGQVVERTLGFIGQALVGVFAGVGRIIFGLLGMLGNGFLLVGRGIAGVFLWLLRLPVFILNSLWVGLKFIAWLFIQPWIFLGRLFLKIILGFGNAVKWLGLLLVGGAVASASGLTGQAQKLWQKPSRPHAWPRWVMAVVIVLAIIAPFKIYSYYQSLTKVKANVAEASQAALADLDQAKTLLANKDFAQAQTSFVSAGRNFLTAQNQLSQINNVFLSLASLAPDQQMQLASQSKNIILAGQIAAKLGENASGLLSGLLSGQANRDWIGLLNKLNQDSTVDLALANQLSDTVKNIDANKLPLEYRQKFVSLSGQADFLATSLAQIKDMSGQLATFLGAQSSKRYLFVFQNNAEMRGGGGFLGSFAVVDISGGKINQIDVPVDGPYGLLDRQRSRRIVPPYPVEIFGGPWRFVDSNWWSDWPASAKQIMKMYEISGGSSADGVITLTPTVMERLLSAMGPIDMQKEYGLTLTADNFWQETQVVVEQHDVKKQYGHPVAPKKMIGDLLAKIMEELPKRLNNKEVLLKVMTVFESSLAEKHIMLYFSDPALEQEMINLGWDGRIKQAPQDYLQVANTNIHGGKSDRMIRVGIEQEVQILPDNSVVDKLTITRTHYGTSTDNLIRGLTDIDNIDWLRVYVPAGSQLLSAIGFNNPFVGWPASNYSSNDWEHDPDFAPEEQAVLDPISQTMIYQEFNKTVFANWLTTKPGESTTATLTYRLPFKLQPKPEIGWYNQLKSLFANNQFYSYSLLVQKQPGVLVENFSLKVILPAGQNMAWTYPDSTVATGNGFSDQTQLTSDQGWAGVINVQK